jgi:hypothetical protein
MYPPADSKKIVGPQRRDRFLEQGHSTLIGDQGAIRIIDHDSGSRPSRHAGADGRSIDTEPRMIFDRAAA